VSRKKGTSYINKKERVNCLGTFCVGIALYGRIITALGTSNLTNCKEIYTTELTIIINYNMGHLITLFPAMQWRHPQCHDISFFVPLILMCRNFQRLMLANSTLAAHQSTLIIS
jgi:hypothetical protein